MALWRGWVSIVCWRVGKEGKGKGKGKKVRRLTGT